MKFTLAVLSIAIISVATQHVEERGKVPVFLNPAVFRYLQQQPAVDPNARLFWRVSTATATTTSTSTYTVTCTFFVRRICRLRRGIEFSEETDEAITPSSVAKVESTPTADMKAIRQFREADPQYYYQNPYFRSDNVYNQAVQPSFALSHQPVYNNYQDASYYYGRAYPHGNNLGRWNRYLFTVTNTLTATGFTVVTFSSTPPCRTPGTVVQCPSPG